MSSEIFVKPVDVRFRHADPAGIMFFGNVYKLAHDTYEDFIQYLGFDWDDWFNNRDWVVPIRHSSCEHLMPIRPAQNYDVQVTIERLGRSSFTAKYAVVDGESIFAEVTLVHTFFSLSTKSKISIPSYIYDRLETYQRECLEAE